MSKRRKGYPSESRVKTGDRVVHGDKELMEMLSGELDVLLPGEKSWKAVKGGESFEVAANSKFKLKIRKLSDYCCSFLKA